jgi:transposase InsO family protein
VSGASDSVKLFGGLTAEGETVFFDCESNFTAEITVHLLQALHQEFGEKIAVVLDNASYFRANAVKDFAEQTPIELIYLPRGSPKLNPVEECWRQFKQFLGNRSFDDLADLRKTIPAALDAIDAPRLNNYLCP